MLRAAGDCGIFVLRSGPINKAFTKLQIPHIMFLFEWPFQQESENIYDETMVTDCNTAYVRALYFQIISGS